MTFALLAAAALVLAGSLAVAVAILYLAYIVAGLIERMDREREE